MRCAVGGAHSMQSASWLVLHPSDDEPLAPVAPRQALVLFRVEVERRHSLQILCSQPRRKWWLCVRAAEGLVEPPSTETGKSTVAGIAGHCRANLQAIGGRS